MQSNFWKKLKKPVLTLAPMSNITDAAFRRMLLKLGRPDVFFTEFVSIDGLFSKGKKAILRSLEFTPSERPIVAQVFGASPELFMKAAEVIKDLGFDGIDINMGCPNNDVEKQGAGAVLIKNYDLAKQVIRATKQGAGNLPVSVKTRLGYSKNEIDTWIPALLQEDLAAITVHLRTRNEAVKVPAHWELAEKIIKLRNSLAPEILIFGNGDVRSLDQARLLSKKTGVDGVMIGRGIIENPWFFSKKSPKVSDRLNAIIEHAGIFEKLYSRGECRKNFNDIKKYLRAYASGFRGAKDLRDSLMKVKTPAETSKVVTDFMRSWKN